VLGTVQVAAAGRVLCEMFGPAVHDDWKPTFTCWFVVDDIALRDGSWTLGSMQEVIVPDPLPRFSGTSRKDEAVLMVYDPETLHVVDTVHVRTPEDRAEWESAPVWLPTGIRAFEHALANTMELPAAPLEAVKGDDNADQDRLTIAQMRSRLTDLERPLDFEHVLLFKSKKSAQQAADDARAQGCAVALDTPLFRTATLVITSPARPSYPAVRPEIHRFRALAERHGGTYDGFGASLR
jgi:hypothetical protein